MKIWLMLLSLLSLPLACIMVHQIGPLKFTIQSISARCVARVLLGVLHQIYDVLRNDEIHLAGGFDDM